MDLLNILFMAVGIGCAIFAASLIWHREKPCPDCGKAMVECRRNPGEICVPVGYRSSRDSCRQAYDELLQSAARFEAVAQNEDNVFRVQPFVQRLRDMADEVLVEIDKGMARRRARDDSESRIIRPPFNAADPDSQTRDTRYVERNPQHWN